MITASLFPREKITGDLSSIFVNDRNLHEIAKFGLCSCFVAFLAAPGLLNSGWQDAKNKVSDFENAVKSGDKSAIRDKMLDIQSDKFALKEINKWPDELKLAYNKEISKMYASVDKRVKKKIIQDLKPENKFCTACGEKR